MKTSALLRSLPGKVLFLLFCSKAFAFSPTSTSSFVSQTRYTYSTTALGLVEADQRSSSNTQSTDEVETTTEKYGLEAGLFQSMQKKDGGASAKQLLTKYGIAYLATSIPLAIVSFALCYYLVDHGVDVSALLSNVGINSNSGDTSEKVGTFAIAYAAHKAASPIRFPPTVILTPVVAKLIGKEVNEEEVEDN